MPEPRVEWRAPPTPSSRCSATRRGCSAAVARGEGCDVTDLRLPGLQEELLTELIQTGKPVVLVLITGRPYAPRRGGRRPGRSRARRSSPARRAAARSPESCPAASGRAASCQSSCPAATGAFQPLLPGGTARRTHGGQLGRPDAAVPVRARSVVHHVRVLGPVRHRRRRGETGHRRRAQRRGSAPTARPRSPALSATPGPGRHRGRAALPARSGRAGRPAGALAGGLRPDRAAARRGQPGDVRPARGPYLVPRHRRRAGRGAGHDRGRRRLLVR